MIAAPKPDRLVAEVFERALAAYYAAELRDTWRELLDEEHVVLP